MRRCNITASALAAAVVGFSASYACAQEFTAKLTGFQELGALNNQTGAILSDGTGTVKLDLDQKSQTVTYTLTYSNVGMTPPNTGTVTQAHIHFGKSRDSGGILVFFCTNLTPPAGVPMPKPCPQNSGTVTGTWTAANVLGISTQNVTGNNFKPLAEALLSNTAYANVHTTAFGAGEIRGQIHLNDHDHDHDHGK